MGLTSEDERAALLELARETAKLTSFARELAQAATLYDHTKSISRKILDLSGAVMPDPSSQTNAAKQKKAADIKIVSKLPKGHGFNPAGYYYGISMDFALGPQGSNTPLKYDVNGDSSAAFVATDTDPTQRADAQAALDLERDEWGLHFGNPLVNPYSDTVYMIRATVSQLRVEPLLGGLILRWVRPVGWTWVDGQSTQIPAQVASNPLVMIRLCKTPTSKVHGAGFQVSVRAQYP